MARGFTQEEIQQIRELYARLSSAHAISKEDGELLESWLKLFEEYRTDIQIILEGQRTSVMWKKVRLQGYKLLGWFFGLLLSLLTAVQLVLALWDRKT